MPLPLAVPLSGSLSLQCWPACLPLMLSKLRGHKRRRQIRLRRRNWSKSRSRPIFRTSSPTISIMFPPPPNKSFRFQPPEAVPQMYAAADALLLNQRSAVEDAVIPSKLLTYMSAARIAACSCPRRILTRCSAASMSCAAPQPFAGGLAGTGALTQKRTLPKTAC